MDHELTSNRFRNEAYISDESALSASPPVAPFVDLGMPPAEPRGLTHPLETMGVLGNSASTEVVATTNNPSVDAAAKLGLRAKEADPWCAVGCLHPDILYTAKVQRVRTVIVVCSAARRVPSVLSPTAGLSGRVAFDRC